MLQGKKVLFIGQRFYDYHEKIVVEIKALGADIIFFENRFFGEDKVVLFDLPGQIRRLLKPVLRRRYTKLMLESIENIDIDFIFCIGGFSITREFLNEVKAKKPSVKTVAYFWDSFSTWDNSSLLSAFDVAFSFDPIDCRHHNLLKYLPLFYTEEYDRNAVSNEDKIDLLYIGSVSPFSSDRFDILSEAFIQCHNANLKMFIWLFDSNAGRSQLGRISAGLKALTDADHRRFHRKKRAYKNKGLKVSKHPMSRQEVADLFKRSSVVLDIPLPDQYGLTIRSIESLAAGKKLITTNKQILMENFYDADSIFVIDSAHPNFDINFITHDRTQKPTIDHLLLKNWLTTIFSQAVRQ